MTTPEKPRELPVRPFAAILQEVDGGKAHAVLSEMLHELVQAVDTTGRKGELEIKVSVAPVKAGNTQNLIVAVSPKLKAPADVEKSSIFFHKGGALTREDPNQPQLPLRSVSTTERIA